MIGSKVILTYKRKRFSSRPGLGFENEGPGQSPGCQTIEALQTPVTVEEDSKHESERKDPEHLEVKELCSSFGKNSLQSTTEKPLSTSVSAKDKSGFPFITFSRRLRHKKTADGTGMEDGSTVTEKHDLGAVKGSNSTKDNGGLLDLSRDFTVNDPNPVYCAASQEKKIIEDVDLHDALSHVAIPKDKQPETSEDHVSAVDESRIISSDGLESTKIAPDKIRDRGSIASFDLSKPPPESSGLVDCNLTLESSANVKPDINVSETHRDSTDSTSRSHPVVFHEFPYRGRVLELLDERIGETSFPARLSSSSNMHAVDFSSASVGHSQTSRKSILQLFPEDGANDMFPLKNTLHETSNRTHLHFRRSTNSTSSFSLSLSSQPRNTAGTSLSSWPNFDTKTQELIQDSVWTQYPSDSVSLMRHKIMLDNIISKARAVSGVSSKSSFSDDFDPPTMWSEEELDFLWIGVRRHGVGNWDAMLRNHHLRFAPWRSPRELAERWEEEQLKLLSTKSPPQIKRFRPQLSLGSRNLNLPHWIREAVRPVEQAATVSYTGHSGMMQWINQPFSGSNRTMGSGPSGGPVGPHQYGPISEPEDVIVINSDASSEETISDDHSVRG